MKAFFEQNIQRLSDELQELLDDKVKSDAEIELYEAKKELEETNDCE